MHKDVFFRQVLALTFLIAVIFFQFLSAFPIYLKTVYRLLENHIGLLIAINTVIIMLLEMLLMEKLKNVPLHKIIAAGSLLIGLGFGIMPLGRGFLFATVTVVIWTFGEMLALPTLSALISNHADDRVRGKYMGLYSFAFSLAMATGPTMGMEIYTLYGPDVMWFGCIGLGIILWIGFQKLPSQQQEQQDK